MRIGTSVVVPVRNGQRFILEAVSSALDQLSDQDEVIVVDDVSTDGTRAILSKVADTRLRVVEGAGRGVSSARNIGLRIARGEFIAFLDHDDIWPAGRHASLRAALVANPDFDAAFGRVGVRIEQDALQLSRAEELEGKHFPALINSALYRWTLLERTGGFAEDMHFGEDLDYHIRLTEAGMRPLQCDVASMIYRMHGDNATNDQRRVAAGQFEAIARKLARAKMRRA
jgi:glycosyltransferase involved in cell wall biosynthesis